MVNVFGNTFRILHDVEVTHGILRWIGDFVTRKAMLANYWGVIVVSSLVNETRMALLSLMLLKISRRLLLLASTIKEIEICIYRVPYLRYRFSLLEICK